jgi:hypothetical protein
MPTFARRLLRFQAVSLLTPCELTIAAMNSLPPEVAFVFRSENWYFSMGSSY